MQEKEHKPQCSHYFANIMKTGDLSSFSWLQGPLDYNTNDNLVRIQYSSINFHDVMVATGRLASEISYSSRTQLDCELGIEYAGITKHGQRVSVHLKLSFHLNKNIFSGYGNGFIWCNGHAN